MAAQGLCRRGVEYRGRVGEFSMQWRQGDESKKKTIFAK